MHVYLAVNSLVSGLLSPQQAFVDGGNYRRRVSVIASETMILSAVREEVTAALKNEKRLLFFSAFLIYLRCLVGGMLPSTGECLTTKTLGR